MVPERTGTVARETATPAAWPGWMMLVAAVLFAIAAAGLLLRADWAVELWPWPDAKLSYYFGASIAATIATVLAWIGWTRDYALLEPIGLQLAAAALAMAAYLAWLANERDDTQLGVSACLLVFGGALMLAIWWWSRQVPLLVDRGPLPGYLVWIFRLFVVVLAFGGVNRLLRIENLFPWDMKPETSTLVGIVFLASGFLFILLLRKGEWAYAAPVMLGFIAYDLVLGIPYLRILGESEEERVSFYATSGSDAADVNDAGLVVYLLVLAFSAVVAFYALFIDRRTRIIGNGEAVR